MIRLFVALRPPRDIRERLLATTGDVPGARWQCDEQLHVTLRFVGEIERHQAEDLAWTLGQVEGVLPPMTLAGVGRFEKRGRIDTLWAALTPHAPLAALHRKVDAACVRVGLAPERRAYVPHITLARFSRSAGAGPEINGWLADHAALASAAFVCPHLVLYESLLGRDGARYEPVARFPLRAAKTL